MSNKPFATRMIHERGSVADHNAIVSYLNSGGLVLSGGGLPTSTKGEIGDLYIDTTSLPFILYGPKTESGWPAATTLAAVVVAAADLATASAAVTAAADLDALKAAMVAFFATLTAG